MLPLKSSDSILKTNGQNCEMIQTATFPLVKDWLVEFCFTSTETVGLLGTGAQDGHFHFHTAPKLNGRRCALYTLESGSAVEYAVQKTGLRK